MRLKSFSRPSGQRTKMWAELNASIDDTDIQKSDRVSLIRLLWAAAAASERKKRPLMGLLGNHTKHTIRYPNILYRTILSIPDCAKLSQILHTYATTCHTCSTNYAITCPTIPNYTHRAHSPPTGFVGNTLLVTLAGSSSEETTLASRSDGGKKDCTLCYLICQGRRNEPAQQFLFLFAICYYYLLFDVSGTP